MDAVLPKFTKDAIATLGSNLVYLAHHGSRAKGEAHAESDYDVILVVKKVNGKVLKTVRDLFKRHARFSTHILSLSDIGTLPKASLLEFMYAKPLYGEIRSIVPTQNEVTQYISHSRGDWADTLRHTLIFPHPSDRKARLAYFMLKNVYIYLSYLEFSESGRLPPTRKETIAYFERRKGFSLGIRLLKMLDSWNVHKDKVSENPDRYLFMLERFFRTVSP